MASGEAPAAASIMPGTAATCAPTGADISRAGNVRFVVRCGWPVHHPPRRLGCRGACRRCSRVDRAPLHERRPRGRRRYHKEARWHHHRAERSVQQASASGRRRPAPAPRACPRPAGRRRGAR